MTTYSKKDFQSQHYDDSRPQYPNEFYQEIIKYHNGDYNLAVDVGCGTGFVTFKLCDYFDKVIGTDPSQTMIDQCNKISNAKTDFIQGSGEKQPAEIEANSVDLITAGECAHWFNHDLFFKESNRVLKSGNGTLAYWLYKDPVFVGHPKANEVYTNYTYNSLFEDGFEKYMGPFYQQPGHDYLRSLMMEIQVPGELFKDVIRNEYIVDKDDQHKSKLFIKKTIDMKWFLNYVKSWSAYHSWMEANGDKYDIAERFVNEIKEVMKWNDGTKIDVIWDTVYVFATKK